MSKCKFTLPFPMPKCVQCLRIYCWRVCGCWRWRGNCANCVPTWRPPGVVMLQPASSPHRHDQNRFRDTGTRSKAAAATRQPGGWLSQYSGAADDAQVPSPTSPYLTLPSYLYPDLTHFSRRQMTKINPTTWTVWTLHLVFASVSDNEYYEQAMYDSSRFIRYLLFKL